METKLQESRRPPTSHTVVLKFKGVFQCRLATDPDDSAEKRGKNGWTFAHTGEPDLDRIIRFNNPDSPRSCAGKVGVVITEVLVDGKPVKDAIIGKEVNLGAKSYFDGSKDGQGNEPIAEFEFHIGKGIEYISGEADMPPKGTGVGDLPAAEVMAIGVDTDANFAKWVEKRVKCLQSEPVSAARDERIAEVKKRVPPLSVRMQSLKSYVSYPGAVDKNLKIKPQDSDAVKKMTDAGVKALSFEAKFSSFDGDGLVGNVSGQVAATWIV